MRLVLNALTLAGFKSFREKSRFEIAAGPGLHFLAGDNRRQKRLGSNGAGKTTLWDAVCFCLYGETVAGLKSTDVRPWGEKLKTSVRLEVSVDRNEHVIKRVVGKGKAMLTIDGSEVGEEAVVRLIGMSLPLFKHAVLHGQGRPLFFDLQPARKMALFSDVLQLQRWDDRADLARQKAREAQSSADRARGRLAAANERLEETRQRYAKARAALEQARAEAEQADKGTAKQLKALRAQLESAMERRDRADQTYDGSETERRHLERERKELEQTRFMQIAESDKYRLAIQNAKQQIATLTKKRERLQQAGRCPTCGQKIKGSTEAHRVEIDDEIKAANRVIKRGVPNAVTSAIEDLTKQLTRNWKDNKQFEQRRDKAEAELRLAREQVSELQKQIAVLKAQSEARAAAPDSFAQAVTDARRARDKAKQALADAQDDLMRAERMATRYGFWVKGFRGVKLLEVEELLAELQLVTNVLLPEFGLEDWRVSYSIERETKSGGMSQGLAVMIQSPDSDRPVRWESWSGGEGQRLRLVGALALAETLLNHAGVDCRTEILDEPTRHMSGSGVADCVEHLAARGKRLGKAIWLTDHSAMQGMQFASVAHVIKGKRGSLLAQ